MTILEKQNEVRSEIESMIATFTPGQQEMFAQFYPDGIPDDKLDWALAQAKRTVEINRDKKRVGGRHGI